MAYLCFLTSPQLGKHYHDWFPLCISDCTQAIPHESSSHGSRDICNNISTNAAYVSHNKLETDHEDTYPIDAPLAAPK